MTDGTLSVAVGASRSGKTKWVRDEIDAPGRYDLVLVWDVEGQYQPGAAHVIRTRRALADLVATVVTRGGVKGRVAYTASLADFGFWADCAFALARGCHMRRLRLAVVAEELADVTTPGKAPDAWGILIRRGLKYGADIYAITQRPSESDKTIMGNASVIHCCGLQRAGDRKYMAAEMDVDVADIRSLVRDSVNKRLEYLHKDMRTGEIRREFLAFPR